MIDLRGTTVRVRRSAWGRYRVELETKDRVVLMRSRWSRDAYGVRSFAQELAGALRVVAIQSEGGRRT